MVDCTISEKMRALALFHTINGGLHTVWPIPADGINRNRQDGIKLLKKRKRCQKDSRNANSPCRRQTESCQREESSSLLLKLKDLKINQIEILHDLT